MKSLKDIINSINRRTKQQPEKTQQHFETTKEHFETTQKELSTKFDHQEIFNSLSPYYQFQYFQNTENLDEARKTARELLKEGVLKLGWLNERYAKTEDILSLEEKTKVLENQTKGSYYFNTYHNDIEKSMEKYSIPFSSEITNIVIEKLRKGFNSRWGINYLVNELEKKLNKEETNLNFINKIPKEISEKPFKEFYNELKAEDPFKAFQFSAMYNGLEKEKQEIGLKFIRENINLAKERLDHGERDVNVDFSWFIKTYDLIILKDIKRELETIKTRQEFLEQPQEYTSRKNLKYIPKEELEKSALKKFKEISRNIIKEGYSNTNIGAPINELRILKQHLQDLKDEVTKIEEETLYSLVQKTTNDLEMVKKYATKTSLSENEQKNILFKAATEKFNNGYYDLEFAKEYNLPKYKQEFAAKKIFCNQIKNINLDTDWNELKKLSEEYIPSYINDVKRLESYLTKKQKNTR